MLNAKSRSPCTVIFVSLIAGCASYGQPSTARSNLDASLIEPCQKLSQPTDGTGGAILRWALATVDAYADCSARHRGLVEATR